MKNFKDSGIEWLGEIPKHWEVVKINKIVTFVNGYAFENFDLNPTFEIPVIRIGDIQKEKILYDNCLKTKEKEKLKQFLISNNDILIALSGATTGKIAFCNTDNKAYINQRVAIVRSKLKLVKYYFLTRGFSLLIELACNGSAQPNISTKEIGEFKIPLPPLKEQEQIANFLDEKCEQIKNFIEKKEKLISLLKEQKQAFINKVTTKGLDKNVNFKDSGIEYLGEIPQHWEVRKLKYITYLRNQKNNNIDFKIGLENIESKTGKYIPTSEMVFEEDGIEFKSGDILFGKLRPYLAKVFLANKNGICVSEFLVLKIKSENNKFIKFLMLSSLFIDIVDGSTYGTKMPRASWEFIGNLKIPLPPLKEQEQIANFLDEQCEKIDLLIEKTKKQIKLIKEYKTALINQAVCGRISL
ncbi:restriction endonuclease subunit S [Campylobacter lari]|nr:restriction endonuclease subunit S [Campylobacter lari]